MNRPPAAYYNPFVYSASPVFANSGDPNIKPNDAYAYEIGYTHHRGEFTLSATLFYRDIRKDFLILTTELPGGVLLEQPANGAATHSTGGEWAVSDRLTSRLTYNFSLDIYHVELNAPNLGFSQSRSEVTGFGRANLNWQITPKDVIQVNIFANSRNLLPQGYAAGVYSSNIGYRHTVNNKVSWMLVAQDPFNTIRPRLVFDTGSVADRRNERIASRALLLTVVWNFAGKPKPASFDFGNGGG
jgi:hypothetical protein